MALNANDDFGKFPQYEIVGPDGSKHGPFNTIAEGAMFAAQRWPGLQQDEDRTGKGWDIQVAGAK